jgi:diguanylate cyclase
MAPEIASVSHRNAQIINLSSKPIVHHVLLIAPHSAGNGCERLCGYYRDDMTISGNRRVQSMASAREADAWLAAYDEGQAGPVTLFLVGIRDLKQINEREGRAAGDIAIRQAGACIRRFAVAQGPSAKIVARLPGREFLLVLGGPYALIQVEAFAENLLDALSGNLGQDQDSVHISARVGVAQSAPGELGAELHYRGRQALAQAYGRKGTRYFLSDGNCANSFRLQSALDVAIRKAVETDQIAIMLQPQFDVATGHLVGAEALARWHHPDLGEIGASQLFAAADRGDLREELSRLIQRKAVMIGAGWTAALSDLRLSVNLGAEELRDGYSDRLLAILGETGFDARRLTLELTEESLVRDIELASEQLEALRGHGVRIAVDDFGTGYSSLAYLKALPLDYLKLDKGMTPDITGTGKDRIVLRAIIAMGKALELKIIAEGVESESELDMLRAEGCDYFQGFLRAPPLSADAFERFALLAN